MSGAVDVWAWASTCILVSLLASESLASLIESPDIQLLSNAIPYAWIAEEGSSYWQCPDEPPVKIGDTIVNDSDLRVDALLRRCWAPEASERPTMQECVDGLAQLLDDTQLSGVCVNLLSRG